MAVCSLGPSCTCAPNVPSSGELQCRLGACPSVPAVWHHHAGRLAEAAAGLARARGSPQARLRRLPLGCRQLLPRTAPLSQRQPLAAGEESFPGPPSLCMHPPRAPTRGSAGSVHPHLPGAWGAAVPGSHRQASARLGLQRLCRLWPFPAPLPGGGSSPGSPRPTQACLHDTRAQGTGEDAACPAAAPPGFLARSFVPSRGCPSKGLSCPSVPAGAALQAQGWRTRQDAERRDAGRARRRPSLPRHRAPNSCPQQELPEQSSGAASPRGQPGEGCGAEPRRLGRAGASTARPVRWPGPCSASDSLRSRGGCSAPFTWPRPPARGRRGHGPQGRDRCCCGRRQSWSDAAFARKGDGPWAVRSD